MAERPFVTVREFAEIFGITMQTVRNMIARNEIPCVRLGRSVRIHVDTIRMVAQNGTTDPRKGVRPGVRREGQAAV